MGNCPAWDPCPMGRKADPNCPVMSDSEYAEREARARGDQEYSEGDWGLA